MKKCVIVPDSFKGSMSAAEVCNIIAEVVRERFAECECVLLPVADGGEGTVDAFLCGWGDGERVFTQTKGPYGEPVTACYAVKGRTAVIELASAAGLPMAERSAHGLNPCVASTYGVGLLIADALSRGCDEIVIGLGGSATNDGGAGLAAALGVVFRDAQGVEFVPAGGSLSSIASIDNSQALCRLNGVKLTVMCDVDNPLYGENGAAYVFAPQKGADAAMVRKFDEGLRHYGDLLSELSGADIGALVGGGAAGGCGSGITALLGGVLKPGIEVVLDLTSFDQRAKGADFIFTGEGRIDGQTLQGKAVCGVCKRAKAIGVPVIALAGAITATPAELDALEAIGLTAAFGICRQALPFKQAKLRSREFLRDTVRSVLSILL